MTEWKNLCTMHRSQSELFGKRTALRYPEDGLYHDLSWEQYRRQTDQAAAGLIDLGINIGDRVAILSENRFEWLIADHAILSTGAADVPLHAPLSPQQVAYQVGHSESRGIFVSSQVQADKVFKVLDDLALLEFLVSFDPIDVPARIRNAERSLTTLTWQGLKHRTLRRTAAGRLAVGRPAAGRPADETADRPRSESLGRPRGETAQRLNDQIAAREAELGLESLATIIYTSGTTGPPKGVMLTHGNLLCNARSTCEISFVSRDDVLLSWLPYSHIYARTVDHYLTSIAGVVVALAESVDTLMDNIQTIQPNWLTSVPRVYEKVWSSVATLDADTRRAALHQAFGPNIRQLTSGGAPLPLYIAKGFFEADIPLLEGYGLTESSPVIAFNSIEKYRLGSVGLPLGDVEVKIADDGEILTRGPHIMTGYWKNPEATGETIVDGWLHTGDVGHLDEDGFLYITDRKKDLFVTSAGKNIAPAELERILARDEFIDQAVVYGDGRQFVTALLVPNFDKLESLCDENGWRLESAGEFISTSAVLDFLQERVEAVMDEVSQTERVKRFLTLGRPLEVQAGELTATLKVRRRHIISRYESDLAGLYDT